ncbi:MAG: inositol 2-dehydrogenase [Acidobacteria bacterium]|nr:inositol 2-dehydrogenase [Acidobacteriota bacterium]
MTTAVKIGVIGAGRIGKVHASTVAYRVPGARIAAVADVDLASAQALASRLQIPRATDRAEDVLGDRDIDAVFVCSSTSTHAPLCIAAAQAGKHVFCEKPIAQDLAAIDRVLAAVASAGVKLQVGFNRRFDANYRRVRQAIETGEIGTPAILHIVSRDPAPPPVSYVRTSGGMFLDMTIHDFDMARFLIGADVEEVYTKAAVTVDPAIGEAGDVDTAVIALTFSNGVIGTIDNCRRASYGYDQRVEVLGSKGAISTANNYPNAATISDAASVRTDLPLNFFMDRYTESFAAEIAAFVDAIQRDAPVPVTGLDGRKPVAIALAAMRSLRDGRPVKVSEVG